MRDPRSDREKFVIAANLRRILATGNLEQARETCEAWAHTYPREALPHVMLSGNPNKAAGRYEEAIAEGRKAIELDPDFAIAYFNIAVNNVYLNRPDEAENALRRAVGRGLEIDEFLMLEHDIAFLKGDRAGMERVAARARERSGGGSLDFEQRGVCLGILGSFAAGKDHVAARGGPGQAGGADGEGGACGRREDPCERPFSETRLSQEEALRRTECPNSPR